MLWEDNWKEKLDIGSYNYAKIAWILRPVSQERADDDLSVWISVLIV